MHAGVSSVAIEGESKDRVVVMGEDVDTVCLGKMLKKKFRGVTVLTVEEVKPKKDDNKPKKEDKDKTKCCTVCVVPCHPCVRCDSPKCVGECKPCSKRESHKGDGGCKPCSKCDTHKCDGECKPCSRCRSYRCNGVCAFVCYGECPPWVSCPTCCVKPPSYPYCRVVYDSQPDSCSIQ